MLVVRLFEEIVYVTVIGDIALHKGSAWVSVLQPMSRDDIRVPKNHLCTLFSKHVGSCRTDSS